MSIFSDFSFRFSSTEVEEFFKKIESVDPPFSLLQGNSERKKVSDSWVIVGGSAKDSNKLKKVLAWQIGQES